MLFEMMLALNPENNNDIIEKRNFTSPVEFHKSLLYKNEQEINSFLPIGVFLSEIEDTNSHITDIKNAISSLIEEKNYWESDNDISPNSNVINNSITLIDSISPIALSKIDLSDIYSTPYGTVIIEWYQENDSLFSLEIGQNSIGYFIEKNGIDLKEVEELSLSQNDYKNTTMEINSDIQNFIA